MTLEQIKAADRISLMTTAICRMTGVMESSAEYLADIGQLSEAIGMYACLREVHLNEPLGTTSEDWCKQYDEKISSLKKEQIDSWRNKLQ